MGAVFGAAGDVDTSFNAETGVRGWVHVVTPLADGKLFIDGEFATVQGEARGGIDATFDSSKTVANYVDAIAVQADSKILVGAGNGIVRLNVHGSLDETFDSGLPNGAVRTVAIDRSGRIVVNSYGVSRLNANGSLDVTFTTAKPDVSQNQIGMDLSEDGTVYLSDGFNKVNGVPRPRLARILGTPVPIALKTATTSDGSVLTWSNPQMQLQSAPAVEGPYSGVIGAKSPWKIVGNGAGVFFRLTAQP